MFIRIIIFLTFFSPLFISKNSYSHTQSVKIEKRNGYFCYDGDTCNARLLGVPKTIQQIKVRINGIDTPEIKGKCEKEKLLAIEDLKDKVRANGKAAH